VSDPQNDRPLPDQVPFDHRLSRQTLLRGAAGAMLGMSPLVAAACGGGSSSSTTTQTTGGGAPKRGGALRVSFASAGTAETLSPLIAVTPIDQARVQQLYDPLIITNPDFSTSPGLALEWNHNADATMWEIKLRPGVTFHNGKDFGADDVIYSMKQMAKPSSYALPFVSNINARDIKKVDKLTVQVPLTAPDADLPSNFAQYNTWIFQDGETDFKHPVGTGPFVYQSFTPGQQSVFTRNANYWQSPKPYVDTLKIIGITDNGARLNALLSGQIDAMGMLPTAEAKAHQSTGDIVVLTGKSPQPVMFYMDVTKPPFNNNDVRTAMKLIVDRPAMIEGALNGFGSVGNDIVGKGLPYYDTSLPQRAQDIEQAKSLLRRAGQQNLTVELQTSQIIPGFVESATLLAQQAKAAGVTINLKQVPANSYYNPSLLYLKMAFAETQWAITGIKFFYLQALAKDAPYNETHYVSASFSDLLNKAIGETDKTKAQGYWNQVQSIQYNQGGYIDWVAADWVDGLSTKVKGMVPSGAGALGNMSFMDAYFG
jgi:peptide/nickel transport system substrate-binding protein